VSPAAGRAARVIVGLAALGALLLLQGCGSDPTQTIPLLYSTHPPPSASGVVGRAPVPTDDTLAQAYLVHMSLDEKLGQLFLAEFVGTQYDANNAAMIEQLHAGGILLYNREMQTFDGTHALIAAAQAHSTLPLLVAVDEEGGYVDRLSNIYGGRPGATDIASTGSTDFARSQGSQVAHDMLALGLNLNLAPDVDVQLVDGPDQSTRTFGSTPAQVISMAGAYLDGLQSRGAIGCLKHFPGLGAATSDAHQGLPVINRTRQQIEQVELAPYRYLIQHDEVGCIMSTDLLMPALDPVLPAELSPATITSVLRQELGYDGVVVTDALYMQGIAKLYSMPEAGVLAIQAGCDFLMGPADPYNMGLMIDALKSALASGQLTIGRIDQSVRRILALKLHFGLLPRPQSSVTEGSGPTGARGASAPVALAPNPRRA
jgi:beta-N-acetylhexosaminidase